MPQNISGAPVAAQSAAQSSERKPASVQVDSYADRLMDDLFEDVEDLLSGSVPPPEPVRAAPQKTPEIVMPPVIASIVTRPSISMPSLPEWNTAAPMSDVDELIAAKPVNPQVNRFQRFLVSAFSLTALTAASIWLIQRGTVQRLFAMATQEPTAIATSTTPKVAAKETNAQFSKYMQRSLENLDRKVANKPASITPFKSNITPFKNSLPPVSVVGNSTAAKTSSPVVINVPSVPSPVPSAPAASKNPQELNQVLTRLSSVLERLSINPSSNPMNPIAIKPNIPNIPAVKIPAVPPSPAPAPVAEAQRALRGIAIATDPTQSAILFEMNGVTQRYYTGESIGSSGWSVVEIANNYVTVRRNGEVRTISIGQKL